MITYSLFSNPGERDNNEDNVGMAERNGEYCFVVADGLGGHGFGEIASKIAVESFIDYFKENGLDGDKLGKAVEKAQENVLFLQSEDYKYQDMKTTIVALHITENETRYVHVGDSRLYHFEKNKLKGRTLDHSVPQMLVLTKEIKEKDIRHHVDRNRLLRVIGTPWENPKYELSDKIVINKKKRQAFLLCTDGFWELIEERNMEKLLKKSDSCEDWLKKMSGYVAEVGQGSGMDNFSGITVWIEE